MLDWLRIRHWDQFCQFPKVLGGCCEEELVAGAIGPRSRNRPRSRVRLRGLTASRPSYVADEMFDLPRISRSVALHYVHARGWSAAPFAPAWSDSTSASAHILCNRICAAAENEPVSTIGTNVSMADATAPARLQVVLTQLAPIINAADRFGTTRRRGDAFGAHRLNLLAAAWIFLDRRNLKSLIRYTTNEHCSCGVRVSIFRPLLR
jgi:hypothetical protein